MSKPVSPGGKSMTSARIGGLGWTLPSCWWRPAVKAPASAFAAKALLSKFGFFLILDTKVSIGPPFYR